MKSATLQAALGAALVLLVSQPVVASNAHRHAHNHYGRKHGHGHGHTQSAPELVEQPGVEKRGTCAFPSHDANVVAITPGSANAGWAIPPDQSCTPGKYCPIACKPGMVMNQWKPNTTYAYPESQYGGLFCDNSGTAQKPFPNEPLCVQGTGAVSAVNKAGKVVSFCQTVLPGQENMIIPTAVTGTAVLAVPGPSYWDATASHFYVNAPGYSPDESCVWGDPSTPIGNWSPYVAGANTVSGGETFVKIAWNPEYMDCSLKNTKPTFGLKIECPGGGCNGLPCSIDPSVNGVGGVTSSNTASGAGGANFCVVTVSSGSSANIVVFNTDGSSGGDAESSSSSSGSSTTSSASPTTSSTTSSIRTSTSTTSSSKTSSSSTSTSSSSIITSTTKTSSTRSSTYSSSTSSTSSLLQPGIFHENGTFSSAVLGTGSSRVTPAPSVIAAAATTAALPTTTSKNDAMNPDKGSAAIAGLIVALVAAAWLY